MIPYWVTGEIKILLQHAGEAFVKIPNGNVYSLTPSTPGIEFNKLTVGTVVEIEITNRLDRVYSARIISVAGECDRSTLGSRKDK